MVFIVILSQRVFDDFDGERVAMIGRFVDAGPSTPKGCGN
jgi:hypothetical protein